MANPKRRDCPLDWVPLEPHRLGALGPDVSADRCPTCQGMFLDKGEVRRVTGNRNLDRLLTKYLGADSDSPLICPGCGGVMDAEQAGSTRVDVCLGCHGVWVDRGEIEALAKTEESDFKELSLAKHGELYDAQQARRRQRNNRGLVSRLGRIFRRR